MPRTTTHCRRSHIHSLFFSHSPALMDGNRSREAARSGLVLPSSPLTQTASLARVFKPTSSVESSHNGTTSYYIRSFVRCLLIQEFITSSPDRPPMARRSLLFPWPSSPPTRLKSHVSRIEAGVPIKTFGPLCFTDSRFSFFPTLQFPTLSLRRPRPPPSVFRSSPRRSSRWQTRILQTEMGQAHRDRTDRKVPSKQIFSEVSLLSASLFLLRLQSWFPRRGGFLFGRYCRTRSSRPESPHPV